jgi:hypothetical protein
MTNEISPIIPDTIEGRRSGSQKKELNLGSQATLEQQSCQLFHRGQEDSPTVSSQKNRKAQALKSNLAKRKQQQRARVNATSATPDQ